MKKRCWLLLLLVALLVVFSSGTALGSNIWEQVEVYYGNLEIIIGSERVNFKNTPFILAESGVAMVPLRELCEALEKTITWDEGSGNVYIEKMSRLAEQPSSTSTPLEDLKVLRNVGPFYHLKTRSAYIASREFSRALVVELEHNEKAEVVIDLYSRYSELRGWLGVEDETLNSRGGFALTVYGDNIERYKSSLILPSEYPVPFHLNVKGIDRLTLHVEWKEHPEERKDVGDYDRVTPALAGFILEK